jgi:ribosomal protein L11 methyltransferase
LQPVNWLEISLTVDGEMAEAVAEVLARFSPDGVAIQSTGVQANEDDENGHAVGPLRVCAYLPADTRVDALRQQVAEALWYLGRIAPLPDPEFNLIQEVNWVEAWKEHYHPIPIGQRLLILPAWLEPPTGPRIPVRIDPGMAFGTGTHPTTQLCLELLEAAGESLQPSSSRRLAAIDVGCGSGILAIAALKLGMANALGVDIDPQALEASRQNAAANGVADRLELGVGSVAEVRSRAFGLRQTPLVFANILAPIIVRLFEAGLAELVEPGGALILSGILAEQEENVRQVSQAHGMALVTRRQQGDWVALLARRQGL